MHESGCLSVSSDPYLCYKVDAGFYICTFPSKSGALYDYLFSDFVTNCYKDSSYEKS